MIKITVVIPAKNREHTLRYCLDSVLQQTYPVDEIIVVDDHSDDGTKKVVESFSANKVRYEYLVQGRGAQSARNHGIKSARHGWIAFQDSDDIWNQKKIEMQIAELKKYSFNNNILIHTSAIKKDLDTSEISPIQTPKFDGDCYKQLLLSSGPMFPSILVSKDALIKIGLLDENCKSYQEWDTSIRLARCCRFVHIQKPLFEWVFHSGSTISKDLKRDVLGFYYVVSKHRIEIVKHHGEYGWRFLILQNFCRAMRYGLDDEAFRMITEIPCHSSRFFANLLLKLQKLPKGSERILYLLSKFPY